MKTKMAALDFGTSKVVAIVAETASKQKCDIIGVGSAAYDGYMDGQWNAPDALNDVIQAAMDEVKTQAKTNITEVTVGVPAAFAQVMTIESKVDLQGTSPKVTARDVELLLTKAGEELGSVSGSIIHRAVAWFTVDDGKKVMDPVGMHGQELRGLVSFVVADPFFTEDLTKRLDSLGYQVRGFLSSSMGQAMLYIPSEIRDHTAVLVDMGYLNTEVMVTEGDALTYLKTLPIGGGHIAMELVYGLNITMNAAESIKRQYVYGLTTGQNTFEAQDVNGEEKVFTREQVEACIEQCANDACDQIIEAIRESGAKLGNWSQVFMTGGGMAFNRGGREFLATKLGKPVRELPRKTAKMTTPPYTSVWGLLDCLFDSYEKASSNSGLSGFFRSLFGA